MRRMRTMPNQMTPLGRGTSDYEEFEEFDPTDQETIEELKTSEPGWLFMVLPL